MNGHQSDEVSSRSKIGLLISPDLFFTSKVTGTAQALGLRVLAVDDIASATAHLQSGGISCVLFDLSPPRASVADVFLAIPAGEPIPVIAFGSHVSTELLDAARATGALVMPRSQFAASLPDLLKQHLA